MTNLLPLAKRKTVADILGRAGDIIPETSIWQLTLSERKNAATFIQYTTVIPFVFMGATFKCFYCDEYHTEIATLLEHTPSHKAEEYKDILERYLSKGKRTIKADISNLECRLCYDTYVDLESIREHLVSTHGKHFYATSNGIIEFNMQVVNNMFVCHICDKDFHKFKLLNAHMNGHLAKVVCEKCGAGFFNQHLLMQHKESHLTKMFNCRHCDKKFYKKSQQKYHTKIVHNGKERSKPQKCPKCPETFKEYYIKMIHLKEVHGITKTFPCHVCTNNFGTRRALTEHVTKIHTEKYKCELCSKSYAIESRLKQHMRSHTGERNFVCAICQNTYMHRHSLASHMKKCHANENVHEVEIKPKQEGE